MAEYKSNTPATGGSVTSGPIRDNFKALSRLDELRVYSVFDNVDTADDTDKHKIKFRGGFAVSGDEPIWISGASVDIRNLDGFTEPNNDRKRKDIVAVNHLGNVVILPGQPVVLSGNNEAEPPALPKGAYGMAVITVWTDSDGNFMPQISDNDITDIRFFNVAGTDMYWNSGPTFQRGMKVYQGSEVMTLPNGMEYMPGTGNLAVFYSDDDDSTNDQLLVKGEDYTEVDQNTIEIDTGSINAIAGDDKFIFFVFSGDGVVKYYNKHSQFTVGSDPEDEVAVPDTEAKELVLDFWYTKGADSVKIYRDGQLRHREGDDPEYEEGPKGTNLPDGELTNKITLKQNKWSDGDRIIAKRASVFKDIAHAGTHRENGDDPLNITDLAGTDNVMLKADYASDGDTVLDAANFQGNSIIQDSQISDPRVDVDTLDSNGSIVSAASLDDVQKLTLESDFNVTNPNAGELKIGTDLADTHVDVEDSESGTSISNVSKMFFKDINVTANNSGNSGDSVTVTGLSKRTVNIPLTTIPDGDKAVGLKHFLPGGYEIVVWAIGVQNESGSESGLTVDLYLPDPGDRFLSQENVATTVLYNDSDSYGSTNHNGRLPISTQGATDSNGDTIGNENVEFTIWNESGAEVGASGFITYSIAPEEDLSI